jgi:hypothetical protein
MKLICPQIRRTVIELPYDLDSDTYLDLSRHIVTTLGLDNSIKAILYNSRGQPFLYNLDLMHTRLPKLDFNESYYVVFNCTASTVDHQILEPTFIEATFSDISVMMCDQKYNISIDL